MLRKIEKLMEATKLTLDGTFVAVEEWPKHRGYPIYVEGKQTFGGHDLHWNKIVEKQDRVLD